MKTEPRIALCTLVLNEMEHLPNLWWQHAEWPGAVRWVFVEAADKVYAETNPRAVSKAGLSTDGTTEWLDKTAKQYKDFVHHIKFGFSSAADPAQGKCAARTAYLKALEDIKPDYVIVVDADEFYTDQDQERILELCDGNPNYTATMLRQRHIWFHSASTLPVFSQEVVGGYWKIPHCRIWKWFPGLSYARNHNWPQTSSGMLLNRFTRRLHTYDTAPQCIHMGFASTLESRQRKHNYYKQRGEGGPNDLKRRMYIDCRNAYETWEESKPLPHGARVIPYTGPVPEVFKNGRELLHPAGPSQNAPNPQPLQSPTEHAGRLFGLE